MATGLSCSVTGGQGNTAGPHPAFDFTGDGGNYCSASGGSGNVAYGHYSSVVGGIGLINSDYGTCEF